MVNKVSRIQVTLSEIGVNEARWYDLYGKRGWGAKDNTIDLLFQPYDVAWLNPFPELECIIESLSAIGNLILPMMNSKDRCDPEASRVSLFALH